MTLGLLFKIVAVILVLTALAVGIYAWVLAQRKKAEKARLALASGKTDEVQEVRAAFAKARLALQKKVPNKAAREKLPRYLVLGEPSSGKTTLLGGTGLHAPLVEGKEPTPGETSPANIWMLGNALAIDVAGRLLFNEDGTAAPETAYRALLAELRSLNPERPIDGIVLTVPCGEVMKGARSTQVDRKRKATNLRSAIAIAEQTLGMNVPVYVVVTQCDKLDGFRSLGAEVSPLDRDDILGWSSPRAPFTENAEDWIDEALDTVREALVRHQARRFASAPAVQSPDDFFLFPGELETLGKGLAEYVDPVFIESGGQETLTLRGIYFTGAAEEPKAAIVAPPVPGAPPPVVDRKVLFSRKLFERKVFAEKNIGKPAKLALRRRERTLYALYFLAGCLAAGVMLALWIDSGRVERRTTTLMPFLRNVQSNVLQAKAEGSAGDLPFDTRRTRARALLEKLETLESGKLRSLLNPATWWSRLDGRVENAFQISFERVLVDAYYAGLSERVELVVPRNEGDRTDPIGLDEWLRNLVAFETNVVRYDGLLGELSKDGSTDVRAQSVADLSEYVLGYKASPTIAVEYYRAVLSRGARRQPFELADRQEPASKKAQKLFAELQQRVLDGYSAQAVHADITKLQTGMTALNSEGANYKVAQLWGLREAIGNVEGHLANPTLAWVTGKSIPSNDGVEGTLKIVKTSRLLGPAVEGDLRKQIDTEFIRLKSTVSSATVDICGELLERGKEKVQLLKVSPCILALKGPIDALKQQSFMTSTHNAESISDLAGKRVDWDAEVLKDTARLPREYEAFVQAGTLQKVDNELVKNVVTTTIADLAIRQLKTGTYGGIVHAGREATPLSGSSTRQFEIVRADVANVAQASIPLRDIIATFVRLRMDDARDRVRELLRAQGKDILGRSADILRGENLYGLKRGGFTWWDGRSTPAYEAFSVPDAGRLSEYAAAQRTRAATLYKELAGPLLSAMESPEVSADADDPSIALWQSIAWPLEDFENKKAGNGVSTLETFMLADLPLITAKNCLAELDKRESTDVLGGFFGARQKGIAAALRERCRVLSNEDMRDRYAFLRRTFNRELSGKFPFVKIEPGIRVEDANPDAVRRFLTDAADFRNDFGYVLGKDARSSATDVGRFMDKIEAVRAFMMPMWANAGSADDGIYDVKVEFRVNPTLEVGGNRIAEWAMRLGDERLFLDGPKQEASWRVNDPVRVDLRWAKSSNDVPDSNQGPGVIVNERLVTFEEKGPWALLRMIAFHQTTSRDASGKTSSGSHVLGFVVQSKADSTGEMIDRIGSDANTVRVFIRVSLTGVEKDKLLRYPEFPFIAPNL